jgi:hypothetical protein
MEFESYKEVPKSVLEELVKKREQNSKAARQ